MKLTSLINLPKKTSERLIFYQNWIAVISTILLVFTLWATIYQARISNQTLISTNRAWVKVHTIFVNQSIENMPLKLTVTYKNIGKEPATNLRGQLNFYHLTEGELLKSGELDSSKICKENELEFISDIAYPDTEISLAIDSHTSLPLPPIEQGQTNIYAYGCLKYETFNETKYAEFCYYLDKGGWNFNNCLGFGNSGN